GLAPAPADAAGGLCPGSALAAATLLTAVSSAVLPAMLRLAAATAIGSPPNGSSANIAQATKAASDRLKAATIRCGTRFGGPQTGLRVLFCPSGVLRSSTATAHSLANHGQD